MLSDPKRLKTASGYGYLVSWKHRLRIESEAQGRELAQRLLADPHNVEQIRQGLGRPSASLEELEEWLASGLAAKALVALKTKPRVPVFDPPQVTNLVDLLPAERPDAEREVRSFVDRGAGSRLPGTPATVPGHRRDGPRLDRGLHPRRRAGPRSSRRSPLR